MAEITYPFSPFLPVSGLFHSRSSRSPYRETGNGEQEQERNQ